MADISILGKPRRVSQERPGKTNRGNTKYSGNIQQISGEELTFPTLIAPPEVAKILGTTANHLAKLRCIRPNWGPTWYKIRGRVFYDGEAVRRYIASCARGGNSQDPDNP